MGFASKVRKGAQVAALVGATTGGHGLGRPDQPKAQDNISFTTKGTLDTTKFNAEVTRDTEMEVGFGAEAVGIAGLLATRDKKGKGGPAK